MSVTLNQPLLQREVRSKVRKGMRRAVADLERNIKESISRGNLSGINPSKPGEAPKVVTGILRSSVTHKVEDNGSTIFGAVGVFQGPATRYAKALELGTQNMGARPFLRPALLENLSRILKTLGGE